MQPPTSNPAISRRDAIKRTAKFMGVALTATTLASALERAAPSGKPPRFLTSKQADLASAIAERILPRSDTPGALDAGVPAFIDITYGKYMTDDEQQSFAKGLLAFDTKIRSKDGKRFAQLPPEQQDQLLNAATGADHREHHPFLRKIRELTIVGYFTSELVGKNVLRYDPIPGRYQGCVEIDDESERVNWSITR